MEQFRSALETFCVPLTEREQQALWSEAQQLGTTGQPELFVPLEQELLLLMEGLALQRGYLKDRFAPKPTYYRLSVGLSQIPAKARKTLGLVSAEIAELKGSVEQMILTTNPAKAIDRAARAKDWQVSEDDFPHFRDPEGLRLVYRDDSMTLSRLNESVLSMDPRTADAWRLITAKSLENWSGNELEPRGIWVDVRELADAMGYRKKTNGAYDPKALEKVARGIADLERMALTLPMGALEFPIDLRTGRRRKTHLEADRTYRVMAVMVKDEVRDLFGTRYPLRWFVQLGQWVRSYPKQFAPILGNLVVLSVKGSDLWAKNIGVELVFHYRERHHDQGQVVLKVQTLLERAGLISELEAMRKSRNAHRAREYFEKALDTLAQHQALHEWNYHPDDEDQVKSLKTASSTALDTWLTARVVILPPKLLQLKS